MEKATGTRDANRERHTSILYGRVAHWFQIENKWT